VDEMMKGFLMHDFHLYDYVDDDDVRHDVGDDVVHDMLIMLDMMLTMSSMTT
jgi:hypothetical protein